MNTSKSFSTLDELRRSHESLSDDEGLERKGRGSSTSSIGSPFRAVVRGSLSLTRSSLIEEIKTQFELMEENWMREENNTVADNEDTRSRGENRMRLQQMDVKGKSNDNDDDDDDDADSEDSESEGDYSEVTDTDKPRSRFWLHDHSSDTSDSSISDEEDQPSGKFDLEALRRAPLPPSSFGGFMLLPTANDESVYAELQKDADIALEEYNKREGCYYEYVSMVKTIPTRSPDNPDLFGQHMNFRARRKGTSTSPELFFGSLGYGMRGVHGCKLDPHSASESLSHEIVHCEHVKCSECSLWISPRA